MPPLPQDGPPQASGALLFLLGLGPSPTGPPGSSNMAWVCGGQRNRRIAEARTWNVRKFLAPLPSLAGPSQLPRVKACPGSLGLRRVWRWGLTAGPDLGQDPSSCLPGRLSGSSQGSTGLVAVALSCQTRVCCAPGHFRDLCEAGTQTRTQSGTKPPAHAVSSSDPGAGRAPASPAALLQKRRRRGARRVRSWPARHPMPSTERDLAHCPQPHRADRKSTRLNSSH